MFVSGAKAVLLDAGVNSSTQVGIIKEFNTRYETQFTSTPFEELVLQINKNEPSERFAEEFLAQANDFLEKVKNFRAQPEFSKAENA